jgi:hypothetical protein
LRALERRGITVVEIGDPHPKAEPGEEAMVETLTTHEIEDQIQLRKVRFQQVVADIRTVLRTDLEAFVVRETKKAFLAQSEVAEAMSSDEVGALKKGALALGRELAARIDGELADLSLWESPPHEPANPRDLAGVPGVSAKLGEAEKAVAQFLTGHGLSADGVSYKLPAYFVGGLYMPSLAEHYWRIVVEIRELEDQKKKLVEQTTREKLQSKWDDAD